MNYLLVMDSYSYSYSYYYFWLQARKVIAERNSTISEWPPNWRFSSRPLWCSVHREFGNLKKRRIHKLPLSISFTSALHTHTYAHEFYSRSAILQNGHSRVTSSAQREHTESHATHSPPDLRTRRSDNSLTT